MWNSLMKQELKHLSWPGIEPRLTQMASDLKEGNYLNFGHFYLIFLATIEDIIVS